MDYKKEQILIASKPVKNNEDMKTIILANK